MRSKPRRVPPLSTHLPRRLLRSSRYNRRLFGYRPRLQDASLPPGVVPLRGVVDIVAQRWEEWRVKRLLGAREAYWKLLVKTNLRLGGNRGNRQIIFSTSFKPFEVHYRSESTYRKQHLNAHCLP